jgi:hypothetical protein
LPLGPRPRLFGENVHLAGATDPHCRPARAVVPVGNDDRRSSAVSLVHVGKEASVAFAHRLQLVDGEGHAGDLDTVPFEPNGHAGMLERLGQSLGVRGSWHHEHRLPSLKGRPAPNHEAINCRRCFSTVSRISSGSPGVSSRALAITSPDRSSRSPTSASASERETPHDTTSLTRRGAVTRSTPRTSSIYIASSSMPYGNVHNTSYIGASSSAPDGSYKRESCNERLLRHSCKLHKCLDIPTVSGAPHLSEYSDIRHSSAARKLGEVLPYRLGRRISGRTEDASSIRRRWCRARGVGCCCRSRQPRNPRTSDRRHSRGSLT